MFARDIADERTLDELRCAAVDVDGPAGVVPPCPTLVLHEAAILEHGAAHLDPHPASLGVGVGRDAIDDESSRDGDALDARVGVTPIDEHFAEHPDSKMTLGVYACGVESFAEDDLVRFNKGTTPLDSLRAVNVLHDLASKYPGRFWFTGLSFILFTPWTTVENLLLNVGLCRLLGLPSRTGWSRTSRRWCTSA